MRLLIGKYHQNIGPFRRGGLHERSRQQGASRHHAVSTFHALAFQRIRRPCFIERFANCTTSAAWNPKAIGAVGRCRVRTVAAA